MSVAPQIIADNIVAGGEPHHLLLPYPVVIIIAMDENNRLAATFSLMKQSSAFYLYVSRFEQLLPLLPYRRSAFCKLSSMMERSTSETE